MKQYDKIWLPCDRQDTHGVVRNGDVFLEGCVKPEANLLVLTIKEAEEIFTSGFNRGVEAKTKRSGELKCPTFKTYLQSKGITIEK